jgi:hypothetical protein
MSSTPVQEARRILDRMTKAIAGARLSKQQPKVVGRNVLESIHRFVQSVQTNLHLDRVRAECERELQQEDVNLISRKTELFDELRSLRHDVAVGFPRVIDEEQARPDDHRPYSLARFDAYMEGAGRVPSEIDEEANHLGSARGAEILSVVLRRHVPDDRPPDDPLAEILSKVDNLKDRFLKVRSTHLMLRKVHPAAKWRSFVQVVADCDPEIDSPGWILNRIDREVPPFRHYVRFLHEPNSLETEDYQWLEIFAAEVSNDALTISSEFHSRLGGTASARWLLQRYARRCRWLRLDEMREAVATGQPREKELLLTRDAAVFLFDQGLNVLTEQSLGQHRYDVIGGSLLVEGKILSARKSPISVVANGLAQLQSYDAALKHEGLTLEPFLVLFRLGGRVADLPSDYLIGSMRVTIVLIDLSPSSETGSKAKAALVITADDIKAALAARISHRRRSAGRRWGRR